MNHKSTNHKRQQLDELKKSLRTFLIELFQIDSPELGFGIYRLLNQRRQEIIRFLDTELLEFVDTEFGRYDTQIQEKIRKNIINLEEQIKEEIHEEALDAKGIKQNYLISNHAKDLNEKWRELMEEEKEASLSDLQKAEIFYHLENFFTRYYKDGDFLSLRRYSANEKYAVPYNGEEVLLHWANKDQYYVKSDRFLRGHGFDVGDYKVMFEVVSSDQVMEKVSDNDKRYFVISDDEDGIRYDDEKKFLTVSFNHIYLSDSQFDKTFPPRGDRKKSNTDDILEALTKSILSNPTIPIGLKTGLEKLEGENSGDGKPKTRLMKHLLGFTRASSSDFFIHRDLRSFLSQELDFYIKNEVFRLDDLGTENELPVERYVKRAKVLKSVTHRIIDFLAQLEDFQKMLWEKKKFVIQSNYCITIDHIPESYYGEICQNDAQIEEWQNLYSINFKEERTINNIEGRATPAYLRDNQFLVLDTAFFDESFKDRILEDLQKPDGNPIDDLDDMVSGLIIKSENWQALNFLEESYREKIDCIYIDPPYNAKSSEILYKNNYKHSSWLTMMSNRLDLGKKLLCNDFTHTVAIDECEQEVLGQLLNSIFPTNVKVCITIVHNPRGQQGKNISYVHDYAFIIYPNNNYKYISDVKRNEVDSRNLRDSGTESDRTDAKTCFYPIIVKNFEIVGVGQVPEDNFHPQSANVEIDDGLIQIWPVDDSGNEKKWRYSVESINSIFDKLEIKKGRNSLQVIFNKDTGTLRTVWASPKYDASEYGTKVLQGLFGSDIKNVFSYPKSIFTVKETIEACLNGNSRGIVLDYFAGSGTTGHAIIELNREDNGSRKFILVETNNYTHSVIVPRIKKLTYSSEWIEGKPNNKNGLSHIFKYMVLESYEDTLDNIEFTDKMGTIQSSIFPTQDYKLRYFLNFETKESPCRLNTNKMSNPFEYTLKLRRDEEFLNVPMDLNGFRNVTLDLIETFNYLMGVHVLKRLARDHNGKKYRLVYGITPEYRKVVFIWRNSPLNPENDMWMLEEDATFIKEHIKPMFPDATSFYVNGHCFASDIEPIEPLFKKLMGA